MESCRASGRNRRAASVALASLIPASYWFVRFLVQFKGGWCRCAGTAVALVATSSSSSNTRNFSLARAARATVGYPRLRKHTRIRGGKGHTKMAFSEAADSSQLPAGISHMGDLKMPCSPILVRPSIAGPASCAGAAVSPQDLPIQCATFCDFSAGLGGKRTFAQARYIIRLHDTKL